MDNHIVKLTQQGLDTLKNELTELKEVKLPAVIKRVADARELGDLSENAEYHAAREDHAWIQGRIEEIEDIIGRSQVIEANGSSEVGVGNKVMVVTTDGSEHEFHIVGEWEADPMQKKISLESPIGKALAGKKVGEKAEFDAPAGKIIYTIRKIN